MSKVEEVTSWRTEVRHAVDDSASGGTSRVFRVVENVREKEKSDDGKSS